MRDGTDGPDPDWAVSGDEAGSLTGAWPTDDWLTGPPSHGRAPRRSASAGTAGTRRTRSGRPGAGAAGLRIVEGSEAAEADGPGELSTCPDPDAIDTRGSRPSRAGGGVSRSRKAGSGWGARRADVDEFGEDPDPDLAGTRGGRTRFGLAYPDTLDSDLRGYRGQRSAWSRAGGQDVIYPDPADLPPTDPDALEPFLAGGDAADLTGMDLSGMCLDGADLSGADPDALDRFLAGDGALDVDDTGLVAPGRDGADPDTARIRRARSRWKGADAAEPEEWFGGEEAARAACLRLLTTAPRTRAQLATALRRRRVPEDVAESVLARFTEVGLIDDAAFARAWVESRHHSKGLARRALAAELRQRGIAAAEVREAVGSLGPQDEMEAARQLVLKRLPASRGRPLPNRARQLLGMLARKGYPAGLAAQVVREALEQEAAENPEARQDLVLMSEETASEGWL